MSSDSLTGVNYPRPFDELVVKLCNGATREIRILSPRLDHVVFDSAELVEALSGLIRGSRQTRVCILVADSRALVSRGHRLLTLARRLPSTVEIRKLTQHPRWKGETVVISDRNSLLFKPGDSDHDGFYEPSSRAAVKQHLEVFEELWHASEQDPELRALTL